MLRKLIHISQWAIVFFIGYLIFKETPKEAKEGVVELVKTSLVMQIIILVALLILVIVVGYGFFKQLGFYCRGSTMSNTKETNDVKVATGEEVKK